MSSLDDLRASPFNLDALRRLLEELEQTDIDELEIADPSSRIFIRRELAAPEPASGLQPQFAARPRRAKTTRRQREPELEGSPIPAPLTGVFYARPEPDQPPFVNPGDLIEPGQVVGLIETMKLFNEVTAEIAGELLSVVISDGHLVEAGQPLMFVNASDEATAHG